MRELTPRQLAVLKLMARGLTNQQIGCELDIALGTVRKHVSAVIDALEVTNRTEAAVALRELGHEATDRELREGVAPDWLPAPVPSSDVGDLTPRQLEVLELLAKGLTNKEIGGVLDISFATVRNHVSAITAALGVGNRTEAAVALQALGLGAATAAEDRAFQVPGFGGRPAVAVLPFDDLSADPDQAHLAEGIVADLITRLSRWRWFPVIARNSTLVYGGRPADVTRVSRELGARYLIEGSVRRHGARLQVSVQLLDGSTAHHLWADKYDRRIGDIFELQDEIASTVVGALEPAITRLERLRSVQRDPRTLDAWACYQRGMHHVGAIKRENVRKALRWLRRAQELDPEFAPAWAAMALCHGGALFQQISESPLDAVAEMMRCVERALRCDAEDPQAQVAAGMARLVAGQREAAVVALERAAALLPSYAFAQLGLCMALRFDQRRVEDAIQAGRTALRLAPHDPLAYFTIMVLASAVFITRRWQEALDLARRSLELNPEALHNHLVAAACEGHLGRLDAARASLDLLQARAFDFSRAHHRLFQPEAVIRLCEEGWAKAGFVLPPDPV